MKERQDTPSNRKKNMLIGEKLSRKTTNNTTKYKIK